MDSSKVSDWLQVIGMFGVIGSLIFVGMQMKQDQQIAQSAAYQARSSQITSIMTEMAAIPEFRSGFLKMRTGDQSAMTPDEIVAGGMFNLSLLTFYENIHYQYINGFLDDEHWRRSRTGLKNFLKGELVRDEFERDEFESDSTGWRDSFRTLAVELIAEIDAETNLASDSDSDPR